MSQELHYTSVPRGLKTGTRGFCTVAMTPQMPGPLSERLESLSGYQPVYPPHDPASAQNPVNFAHVRFSLGGRPASILSRVGPAGLDYTGRANKYAHHVVLDAVERPDGGPAWLLGQPGFMQGAWDGEPRMLDQGRPVPKGDHPGGIATAWAALTGDPGWAGVLAEAFLIDPKRPAFLVFRPGMDLLPLFAEAIALLPPSRRWEVEFSTYLTQAPRGISYAWRGVLEGSPEAANAHRLPNSLVIDLCGAPGRAEGGPLVHTARTGEHREWTGMPTVSVPAAPVRGVARPTGRPVPLAGAPPSQAAAGSLDRYELIPELAERMAPKRLPDRERVGSIASRPRKTRILIAGILAACLLGMAGMGSLAYFSWKRLSKNGLITSPKREVAAETDSRSAKPPEQPPAATKSDGRGNEAAIVAQATYESPKRSQAPPPAHIKPPNTGQKGAGSERTPQGGGGKVSVAKALSPPDQQNGKVAMRKDAKTSEKEQGTVSPKIPSPSEAPQASTSVVVFKPSFVHLKEPESKGDPRPQSLKLDGRIRVKRLKMYGASPELKCPELEGGLEVAFQGAGGEDARLAHFEISPTGGVSFQWDRAAKGESQRGKRERLRGCFLQADAGDGKPVFISLRKEPSPSHEPIRIPAKKTRGQRRQASPLSVLQKGKLPFALVKWSGPDQDTTRPIGNVFISGCMVQLPGSEKAQPLSPVEDENKSWRYGKDGKQYLELHYDETSNQIRLQFPLHTLELSRNISDLDNQLNRMDQQHPQRLELSSRRERLAEEKAIIESLIEASYSMILIEKIEGKSFEIARIGEFAKQTEVYD